MHVAHGVLLPAPLCLPAASLGVSLYASMPLITYSLLLCTHAVAPHPVLHHVRAQVPP